MQLALAALWLIAAGLQLQPFNFGEGLANSTIRENAGGGQPEPIRGSIIFAADLLEAHTALLNVFIVVVQVTIAAGLLWRRTVKPALVLSFVWALGVWWIGEGFAGLAAGRASLLVGAPGAAPLYALVGLIAWPAARPAGRTIASVGLLGDRGARWAWVILWVGGAFLRVQPSQFSPRFSLYANFTTELQEQPAFIADINRALADVVAATGWGAVIFLAVLNAVIGLGVLSRHHDRIFLRLGIVVSLAYWATAQKFGDVFTGEATDLESGPLYVLLALTLYPLASRERRDDGATPDRERN